MRSPAQTRKDPTLGLRLCLFHSIPRKKTTLEERNTESERWQYDHWRAKDATRGVFRTNYHSILHRWHTDKRYQESQWNHGWTEAYCGYLDYLATIDISHIALWPERSRYHNMLVLKLQIEINLQPDHLLFSDTKKGGKTLYSKAFILDNLVATTRMARFTRTT